MSRTQKIDKRPKKRLRSKAPITKASTGASANFAMTWSTRGMALKLVDSNGDASTTVSFHFSGRAVEVTGSLLIGWAVTGTEPPRISSPIWPKLVVVTVTGESGYGGVAGVTSSRGVDGPDVSIGDGAERGGNGGGTDVREVSSVPSEI